ncbi:MAG: nitroreductase family protein [Candidatus Aenigmarchaeota archaeon]|nr:nitroreductase family protein [Candidatus Aenigmarchaeota archaeon]NIP41053.1 nitroreductase family protein [Candidatus Aenigmarchaeota archaeon]NIQ17455.1 nitroreductase family protein [Candidatus Aenigmarchaeota archaeon]NIS73649.1 nitroreductase family protein [Candidatus Aenigmarchaeota archaeon]
MNDFIRLIKDRRSVREYTDRPIEKRILEEIVDAGRLAPSARNIQPWKFLMVTEKGKLSEIAKQVEWGHFIKDSTACVVICGEKGVKRRVEDCCLAAENMILAAKSLGVGSCYVAALQKDVEGVRNLLNVPENLEIVCFLSLGYFEKNPEPHDKKELEDVIHWESF